MSRDCCVALPRGAMGLSASCDCGISLSYSLTIYVTNVTTISVDYIHTTRASSDPDQNICKVSNDLAYNCSGSWAHNVPTSILLK